MKKYKVLFCDLDGTLIETLSGKTFPQGVWDMKFKFDVLDAIKKLAPDSLFIVSNQGGIENGFVDRIDFNDKMSYIVSSIKEYCHINTTKGIYCPHNDKNNQNRKPNTGMLNCLKITHGFSKEQALMIGDASGKPGQFSDTDKKTAENFGIDYMDVQDFVKKSI